MVLGPHRGLGLGQTRHFWAWVTAKMGQRQKLIWARDKARAKVYGPGKGTHSLRNVFGHHGVEAVEKVSTGHGEDDKGEKQLRPAAVRRVAKVTRLAVERDDKFHVVSKIFRAPRFG